MNTERRKVKRILRIEQRAAAIVACMEAGACIEARRRLRIRADELAAVGLYHEIAFGEPRNGERHG